MNILESKFASGYSNVEKRKNKDKQKIYTNEFACQVMIKVSSLESLYDNDVTEKLEVNVDSQYALDAVLQKHTNLPKKIKPSTRHQKLFRKFHQMSIIGRARRLKIFMDDSIQRLTKSATKIEN